ncbi:Fic family protein [Candidatus Absconditicoccus praedator]|uniref:Fic family protein n=1 Tax=Candidatus Absconditicoccus praedator TaxID=2735562 RepID=UPI001E613090|nr:Fic/DOC family N-terminal domain-containing protein [Candidatus Absconditicoccus praedator]UFX82744.1 Fic family protein [Candidatus Absconditicoccus praedator]
MKKLPLNYNFLKPKIIKKVIEAHKALAELNGLSQKIPNQNILINSLSLQEAKDSSEVENIITTHDELYKASIDKSFISSQTKEVINYKEALLFGFNKVKSDKILSNKDIIQIQEIIEGNNAGFRTQMGTKLKNDQTGETIYTPPQNTEEIKDLMSNLEQYINKNLEDIDPLIKMAIIHHQFESIHPFYDGNGRTGRIINILYLVKNDLLNMPILYLSNYIINNKSDYYKLLQDVRDNEAWDEWILYMLDAIEKTSIDTIKMINNIWTLMGNTKKSLKDNLPKIYSKDLLEMIFSHPYTKIEFLVNNLGIHRETASKYLNSLVDKGYMTPVKIGKNKYFVNIELFELLRKGL